VVLVLLLLAGLVFRLGDGAAQASVRPAVSPAPHPVPSGTVTLAEQPEETPSWIFPLGAGGEYTVPNIDDFQYLL